MENELLTICMLGAAIGLSNLLRTRDQLTLRAVLGSMGSGAATALASYIALLLFPRIDQRAQIGLACLSALLGPRALTRWAEKLLDRRHL